MKPNQIFTLNYLKFNHQTQKKIKFTFSKFNFIQVLQNHR